MNVASAVASPAVDALRLGMSEGQTIAKLPPYAFLIAITAFLHLPIIVIAAVIVIAITMTGLMLNKDM